MDGFLPLHPESNRELLGHSFTLYRKSFSKVFIFALLIAFIVFIPRLISDVIGQDIFSNLAPLSWHRLWFLLINLASLLFFTAIIWHMYYANIRHHDHDKLMDDMNVGLHKIFYILIASLLESVIVFGVSVILYGLQIILQQHNLLFADNALSMTITSLLFCGQLLLILYISTLFIFFIPLIAIENKGILGALQRSVSLVWNHWWRVFTLQLTPWLCYFIFLFTIKYSFNINIHIYFLGKTTQPLWITVLHLLLFAFFVPWVAALLIIQLKDLELRKHLVTKLNERP
jgi:hypothetical protein